MPDEHSTSWAIVKQDKHGNTIHFDGWYFLLEMAERVYELHCEEDKKNTTILISSIRRSDDNVHRT